MPSPPLPFIPWLGIPEDQAINDSEDQREHESTDLSSSRTSDGTAKYVHQPPIVRRPYSLVASNDDDRLHDRPTRPSWDLDSGLALYRGPCRAVPLYLKCVARLVACHEKSGSVAGGRVRVFVGGCDAEFTILANIDIGQNVKCLAMRLARAVPPNKASLLQAKFRSALILSFNWFSPSGVLDYLSLGARIVAGRRIDDETGMIGALYLSLADQFISDATLSNLISASFGNEPNGVSRALDNVIVTGFSLGGAIAHAIAYRLKTMYSDVPIRVWAFGANRPGNSRFRSWCDTNLEPDSMNVLLAAHRIKDHKVKTCSVYSSPSSALCGGVPTPEPATGSSGAPCAGGLYFDPITRMPALRQGFSFHPFPMVLLAGQGTLKPLGKHEMAEIQMNDDQVIPSSPLMLALALITRRSPFTSERFDHLFSSLHSITAYYSALCGMSEDSD